VSTEPDGSYRLDDSSVKNGTTKNKASQTAPGRMSQ
jgi:hypothetical protein